MARTKETLSTRYHQNKCEKYKRHNIILSIIGLNNIKILHIYTILFNVEFNYIGIHTQNSIICKIIQNLSHHFFNNFYATLKRYY